MDKLTTPGIFAPLLMAVLLSIVTSGCSSDATSGDVVPREECPPLECPAPEAQASPYKPGDKVEALWGGTWWAAEVRAVNRCGLTKIGFDGYDASSDEWVEADRVRVVGSGEEDGATQTPVVIRTYQKDEPVRIEWSGTWFDGVVVEARPPLYKVRYDGYDASADEWVPPARLDRREGATAKPDSADAIPKDAKRVEVEWGGHWYPAFVLESRQDGESLIRYEGFDKNSDEWVLQRRVRPFRQPSQP